MFPRNNFFKQAFSEAALGYIGKTFIYRTSKIEQLGFKFETTPAQSIQEGLEYMAKIPEYSKYNMQPYIFRFSKDVVMNTAIDLKEAFELFAIARVNMIEKSYHRRVKTLLTCIFFLLVYAALMIISNLT